MIVAWIAYAVSIGMLIAGILIGYFVGRYNKRKAYMQGLHDGSHGRATPGIPWEDREKEGDK
jgi:hypothetical protein